MVGLVLSDTFLLTASWDDNDGDKVASGILQIPFTESISSLLHDESELNAVLASALRQAREANPFEGQKIYVCLLYTSPSPRDRPLSRMPSSA